MQEEYRQKLLRQFGAFLSKNLVCTHGDGWYPTVRAMCRKIEQLRLPQGFRITHLEEDRGMLQVRHNHIAGARRLALTNVIAVACRESTHRCEVCGRAPGEIRHDDGVTHTRCKQCAPSP